MNILFLAPRVPWPLDTGGKIRTYHMLKGLARYHSVVLVAFWDNAMEREGSRNMLELGVEVELVERSIGYQAQAVDTILGATTTMPITMRRYERAAMRARIREVRLRKRIDIVHCDHLHMAQYGGLVGAPFSIDEHNIESVILRRAAENEGEPILKRMAYWQQYLLLRHYEGRMAEKAWACLVTSEEDRRELTYISKQRNVRVVPNGVDLAYFGDPNVRVQAEGHLCFVGSMDWQPNEDAVLWFHTEILPEIRYVFPRLPFYIVGRNPSKRVRALGENDPATIVTGTVADVRPYLKGALALVVPIRVGGGTRLKIPEAFAARVPVISTRVGAEGILAEPERHFLAAETPKEFAVQVRRLATDEALRKSLIEAAAELVNARYGWEAITREVAEFYEGAPPRTVHS